MIRVFLWRICFELLRIAKHLGFFRRDSAWYFAYGANMDSVVLKERNIEALEVIDFCLNDQMLSFDHYGPFQGMAFANITPFESAVTFGKLLQLNKIDLMFMDFFEGVPFLGRYKRVKILQSGYVIYVYVSRRPRPNENLKPSRNYIDKLLRGLSTHSFVTADYIKRLENIEVIDKLEFGTDVGFVCRPPSWLPSSLIKLLKQYDKFVIKFFIKHLYKNSFQKN